MGFWGTGFFEFESTSFAQGALPCSVPTFSMLTGIAGFVEIMGTAALPLPSTQVRFVVSRFSEEFQTFLSSFKLFSSESPSRVYPPKQKVERWVQKRRIFRRQGGGPPAQPILMGFLSKSTKNQPGGVQIEAHPLPPEAAVNICQLGRELRGKKHCL